MRTKGPDGGGIVARWGTGYVGTVFFCAVVLWWGSLPGFGLNLVMVLLLATPWLSISLIKAWIVPAQRRPRLIKAGLWIATLSGLIVWHMHLARAREQFAHDVLAQVDAYRQANGRYPDRIEDVGFSREFMWRRGVIYYFLDGSDSPAGPTLMYQTELDPFDRYVYDFDRRVWNFQPD